MQIIKPPLGIQTSLLGAANYLGIPNRLFLKKESYFRLRSPLINYSKLLLRRQHKSLKNFDTWNTENRHDDRDFDISTNILPIDFTGIDATPKQNYIDNTDIGRNIIVNNILPEPIEKHKNINNPSQLNQKKSKSKKTNKSKPKVKSKKQDQSLKENNTIAIIDDRQLETPSFNIAETEPDKIRLKESPLPAKHIIDLPENSLPSIPTSSQVQNKPILLEELGNNQLIISEEIKDSGASENLEEINFSNTPEKLTWLQQSIDSETITNKFQETTSFISTNLSQNSEKYTFLRDTNDEQLGLEPLVMPFTEVTQESIISNIPINSTPQPQNTNLDITTNLLQNLTSEALKTNLAKAEQPTFLKDLPNDKQQVTPELIPESSLINLTLQPQDIELDNITDQTNLKPIIQTPTGELVQQKIIVEDSLNVSQYIRFSDVDASKIPPTSLVKEGYIPPLKREFMGDKTLSDKYWDVPYSPIPDKETKEQSKLHTSNQPEKLYNQENSTDSLLKSENPPTQESFPELSTLSQKVALESQESIPVLPAATVDNTEDTTLLRTITNEQQTLSTTSSLEISEEVDVSEISKSPTSQNQNTNVDNTTLKLQESLIYNFSNIEEKLTASKKLENEKQIITSEIAVVHPQISEKLHVLDIPEDIQASHSKDVSNLPDSQHNQDNTLPIEALENKPFEIPAPAGFATGGLVAASQPIEKQQIASSDIIPAMLTPGEFVINVRDAQQNLDVLHYLNSGGTLPEDIIFPTAPTPESKEEADTASINPSTKVNSFKQSLALQENVDLNLSTIQNLPISPSPDLGIRNQGIAIDSSLQFNTFANSKSHVSKSNDYLSPQQIFRQKNTNNTNAPSQWSNVEELLNGNNELTIFNFGDVESSKQNLEDSSMDESPKIFAKQLPSPKGFAEGGEVTATDIATNIEPITETIQRPSDSEEKNSPDLETLAREIYHRLRQRLEIERERHGIYLGRLPW